MTSGSMDNPVQVEISLPEELLAEIDRYAARTQASRSAVVQEALEE